MRRKGLGRLPSAERVREALDYDPATGAFVWREKRSGVKQGGLAGRIARSGYHEICVDRRLMRAHRLAWLIMTGDDTDLDIDHINGDRADNRWANLRLATPSQNMANAPLKASNTSGAPGVTWDKTRNKWRAQLRVDGRKVNLGRFDSFAEAEQVVRKAAIRQWGEYVGW